MNAQQFFDRIKGLPVKAKVISAVSAAVLLLATSIYVHHQHEVWAYNHSPEHTFAVLDQIHTLQDLEGASEYLTPIGKHLLSQTMQSPKSGGRE